MGLQKVFPAADIKAEYLPSHRQIDSFFGKIGSIMEWSGKTWKLPEKIVV